MMSLRGRQMQLRRLCDLVDLVLQICLKCRQGGEVPNKLLRSLRYCPFPGAANFDDVGANLLCFLAKISLEPTRLS